MTDGMKTIQVTEEEFEYLIKLRSELQRRKADDDKLASLPGGKRGVEFAMGAVAGFAAHYLYKELLDDDDDDDDDEPKRVKTRPPSKGGRR